MITYARVKALFDYDPVTGELWRKADGSQGRHDGPAGSKTYKLDRNGVSKPLRRIVMVDRKVYPEHRIIWLWMTGVWSKAKFIDHEDTNPFNNSWSNLREANDQQSLRNRKAWNSTGYKWVTEQRRPGRRTRYNARLTIDGSVHNAGSFRTPEEAHQAALAVAQKLYGPFARAK